MMLDSKHIFLVNMYYTARFIRIWTLPERKSSTVEVISKHESSVLADTDANALLGMVPHQTLLRRYVLYLLTSYCLSLFHYYEYSCKPCLTSRHSHFQLACPTITSVFFSKQTFNLHENSLLKAIRTNLFYLLFYLDKASTWNQSKFL